MTSLMLVAVIPDLFVLLAGSGLLLFRRQRLGSVAWVAVGALAMLIVALVTDTVWTVYQVNLLTGDHDGAWRVVLQWNTPIRSLAGALSTAGMLLLVLSIFTGRRPRGPDVGSTDRESAPGGADNAASPCFVRASGR
ncbi:hypothetical protein ONA91_16090 [Micromonospora sp. DR5-3]|uniref:hypothetical protein n=1 Tax=unclassified Micromonospora TaxID=2617518 RepID=UPI0011D81A38|nr:MULTISPECIES: hypothetical protein [unclassified Micromonospora]MCW3815963.1 hypothetical protein [Micromonospora sp. DR5-3]TYC24455.1 hypothetical protein FXF52_10720 [Micromonospora sp. MP36]